MLQLRIEVPVVRIEDLLVSIFGELAPGIS
jgi:hypothetical protein